LTLRGSSENLFRHVKALSPIEQATRQYEAWLAEYVHIIESDLAHKYKKMRADPSGFIFFRGTFYRWAKLWEKKRKELRERRILLPGAPEIFSVGDLHIENFGTWRDAEGRLAWGINDVDEAYAMRYQNDLVRLATSAFFAMEQGKPAHWNLTREQLCAAILEGYAEGLETGGKPWILERHIPWLWKIATHPSRTPERFCADLQLKVKKVKHGLPDRVLKGAERALREVAPKGAAGSPIYRRRAGVGSLGRPRLLQFFTGLHGQVVRETKTIVPSACVFLGWGKPLANAYRKVLRHAVRVHDPVFGVVGDWVVRRLAFDSDKIALESLGCIEEVEHFFRAMGAETANLHLGDPRAAEVKKQLRAQNRKQPDWLFLAAEEMAEATRKDFTEYLESKRGLEKA
jgi:Uncharacterized protein conserved in bacteria (DUF2252)